MSQVGDAPAPPTLTSGNFCGYVVFGSAVSSSNGRRWIPILIGSKTHLDHLNPFSYVIQKVGTVVLVIRHLPPSSHQTSTTNTITNHHDMVAIKMSSGSLPRMGLGMAALGRPGYINLDRATIFGEDERTVEKMQTQANLVMDQLFQTKEQMPWLDCARSYGLSEKFVGEYLRNNKIAPDQVYVSSKWGYTYVADFQVSLAPGAKHEVKDHSKANFLKQVKETEEYLGEYLDLYQIHSATFDSGILTDQEAHLALGACRQSKGWAIGLSVSGPGQDDIIREAMKIRVPGDGQEPIPLFDSVQCTYNVLEQRPGPALMEAHTAGMDIIIKEGLANGRALRNPSIQDYSKKMECEPDQLALACILAQPFAPRVLSGAVTPEQLASNLQAQAIAERLRKDTDLLNEITSATCMDSEQYWSDRAALAWN